MRAAPVGESAALSRDLAEFLIELSIALHKNAIYPTGHPLLENAVDGLVRKLDALLKERAVLSLGVARHQLVIEGVVTDPGNPLLRELAARLHRHHLGAVKFSQMPDAEEVIDFLRTIAADAGRSVQPLGLGPPEGLGRWPHIRPYALTYEQLELLDGEEQTERGETGMRAEQLWIGLARAALAAESSSDAQVNTDPSLVAKAIDEHSREVAYDQVIVGYLLQIANELKVSHGKEAAALRRRMSKLVAALQPDTLRRLLEMGGDVAQRKRFVLDASQGMTVDAVIELVQAAADTSDQTISHALVRLLSKLAAHAEQGPEHTRAEADSALREHVQRLIAGWTLEDPNPGAYRDVLDGMSRSAPLFLSAANGNECEADRVLKMSLEVGVFGDSVLAATNDVMARGGLPAVLDLLDAVPEPNASVEAVSRHVATQDRLRKLLLDQNHIDFALADRVIARMGLAAAEPMLDALEEAETRTVRRKLLDRLVQLGQDLGPLLVRRLDDERWFVQRNMLFLLNELSEIPVGFSALSYVRNADARVRREAVKLMVKSPEHRDRAVHAALADYDEFCLKLGLNAAIERCPPSATQIVMNRIVDRELSPELRALAIRVLASIKTTSSLEWLLQFVFGGKPGASRERFGTKSPELLAALSGLATHWRGDARVAPALALASRNSDPEIRAAAATRDSGLGSRHPGE